LKDVPKVDTVRYRSWIAIAKSGGSIHLKKPLTFSIQKAENMTIGQERLVIVYERWSSIETA
jgi:hypothetical protein